MQLHRFRGYRGDHQADVYGIIFTTSAVALSYNVVHSMMIQQTSAVTTTVLGEAKIIGLMILSYVVLGMPRWAQRTALVPNNLVSKLAWHGMHLMWLDVQLGVLV